jgi:hypothetical protein
MIEITYQMVLSTLQTIALIVGIAYYLIIMRNSQRAQQLQLETRQAQFFMDIYETYRSLDFRKQWNEVRFQWEWDDFDDYWKRYGPDTDNMAVRGAVFGYYEGIGVLIRKGLIDAELVAELLAETMISIWEKYEDVIMEQRRVLDSPTAWNDLEYLYDMMAKYVEEHPEKYG